MSASDRAGDRGRCQIDSEVAGSNSSFVPRPKPATNSEYEELNAPIIRVANERGRCRLVGKAFNHSTLYWDVVSIAGTGLVTRRVAKAKAHTIPCTKCPAGP